MNNDETDIRKKFRQLKMLAKYGIFGMVVLGTIHCILLYFGTDHLAVHAAAVCFACLLGLALSRLFGLCNVHKAAVFYICFLLLFIALNRFGLFGNLIQPFRLGMFVIGMILSIALLWKARKNY